MSSRAKKKADRRAVVLWTPFEECFPAEDARKEPHRVWRNSRYQVIESEVSAAFRAFDVTHLSIRRLDREPIRDWRDLQRIKNELCGPEREGVEVYPAESRLVDTSNQYHLWVLPAGTASPFGFFDGRLVTDRLGAFAGKAKQRPFDETPAGAVEIPADAADLSEFVKSLRPSASLIVRGLQGVLEAAKALLENPTFGLYANGPPDSPFPDIRAVRALKSAVEAAYG